MPSGASREGTGAGGGAPAQSKKSCRTAGISQMLVHTDYLWFNTKKRQEFVRITDDIAAIVSKSGVKEGTVLVSAMHITAGVFVNDWGDGLLHAFWDWVG